MNRATPATLLYLAEGRAAIPLAKRLAILILPALAFLNAAWYIAYAANPLAMADAWYFIEAVLIRTQEQGLDIIDLYVKRGGSDHAQPLQKLLLLANARWFGLDFVMESFAGLCMALGTYLVIQHVLLRDQIRQRQPFWQMLLACAAIATTLVSLNSGMVFNWSLVTLGYLPHLFAAIAATFLWRSLQEGKWSAFAVSFLVIGFTLDAMAMIIGASFVLACVLSALLRQSDWRRVAGAAVCILLMLAIYKLVSHNYLHAYLPPEPPAADKGRQLIGLLPELPAMAATVLSASLIHPGPLGNLVGDQTEHVQLLLACLVAFTHLWFWHRTIRGPWNASMFLSVCIMLMFYASVAGIIVGRVTMFGPSYLEEPRYVLTYQMSTVALLLMLAGAPRSSPGHWRSSGIAVAIMLSILALQLPLSLHSWHEGRFLQSYYHTMARQMYLLGLNPAHEPDSCVPMLTICSSATGERVRAIQFLKDNQLNAYSPALLHRYSLEATATPPNPPEK